MIWLYVWVPCEVEDKEDWGERVISGVPVVCDGGVTVGAVLTMCIKKSPVISKSFLSLSHAAGKQNKIAACGLGL